MVNYKIGDLVNRINSMYTKFKGPEAGPLGHSVPYTKDNYQIITQLVKLGMLNTSCPAHISPPLGGHGVGEETGEPFAHKGNVVGSKGGHGFNIKLYISPTPLLGPNGAQIAPPMGAPQMAPKGVVGDSIEPLGSVGKPLGGLKVKKNLLTLISKPGRKIYVSYKDLKHLNNGFKVYILRTSQGIITSQTAYKNKLGGELLLKISFAGP